MDVPLTYEGIRYFGHKISESDSVQATFEKITKNDLVFLQIKPTPFKERIINEEVKFDLKLTKGKYTSSLEFYEQVVEKNGSMNIKSFISRFFFPKIHSEKSYGLGLIITHGYHRKTPTHSPKTEAKIIEKMKFALPSEMNKETLLSAYKRKKKLLSTKSSKVITPESLYQYFGVIQHYYQREIHFPIGQGLNSLLRVTESEMMNKTPKYYKRFRGSVHRNLNKLYQCIFDDSLLGYCHKLNKIELRKQAEQILMFIQNRETSLNKGMQILCGERNMSILFVRYDLFLLQMEKQISSEKYQDLPKMYKIIANAMNKELRIRGNKESVIFSREYYDLFMKFHRVVFYKHGSYFDVSVNVDKFDMEVLGLRIHDLVRMYPKQLCSIIEYEMTRKNLMRDFDKKTKRNSTIVNEKVEKALKKQAKRLKGKKKEQYEKLFPSLEIREIESEMIVTIAGSYNWLLEVGNKLKRDLRIDKLTPILDDEKFKKEQERLLKIFQRTEDVLLNLKDKNVSLKEEVMSNKKLIKSTVMELKVLKKKSEKDVSKLSSQLKQTKMISKKNLERVSREFNSLKKERDREKKVNKIREKVVAKEKKEGYEFEEYMKKTKKKLKEMSKRLLERIRDPHSLKWRREQKEREEESELEIL